MTGGQARRLVHSIATGCVAAITTTVRAVGTARRLPVLRVFTGTGAVVLAGSVCALVVGAWADWAEAALAGTVGLIALGLCSLFTVGRTQVSIDITVQRRRLRSGEQTTATVRLTNLSRRPLLPLTVMVPVSATPRAIAVPLLVHNAQTAESFGVYGTRRGIIPIGPVTTVRGDPLGLLARTIAWTGIEEVFVHPDIVDVNPIGAGLRHDLEGRTGAQLSASDLAFHTLRDYVPGDDRRYIHWRSSAKVATGTPGGRFLVRQFLETRRTHILVVVDGDAAAYPDPDDFEVAISAGASVALQALRDGLEASILVSGQVAANAGRSQLLDACARAESGTTALPVLIARAAVAAPQATVAFIVTGATPALIDLRRAASRIPIGPATTVLRVDPSGHNAITTGGSLTVLTMRTLADLRGILEGAG